MPERSANERSRRDWSESATLLACVLIFVFMPAHYSLGPPIIGVIALGLLMVCFVASLIVTIAGTQRPLRMVLIASAFVIACIVVFALSKVIDLAIYQAGQIDGARLIQTAVMIWVGNVVVFAIFFSIIGEREFVFPQPQYPELMRPRIFLDYVFLSFTTATAFSPTDTAPVSTRARMLMMVEATVSLLTIAVAAARAINILPQGG